MRRTEILIISYRRISVTEDSAPLGAESAESNDAGSDSKVQVKSSQPQELIKTPDKNRASWLDLVRRVVAR